MQIGLRAHIVSSAQRMRYVLDQVASPNLQVILEETVPEQAVTIRKHVKAHSSNNVYL